MGRYDYGLYSDEELSDDDFIRQLLEDEERGAARMDVGPIEILSREPPPAAPLPQGRGARAAQDRAIGAQFDPATDPSVPDNARALIEQNGPPDELGILRRPVDAPPAPPPASPEPAQAPMAAPSNSRHPVVGEIGYQDAAARMSTPEGLYGLNTRPGYNPLGRAPIEDAYARAHGGLAAPRGAPSTAFQAQAAAQLGARPSEEDLQRAWMIHTLLGNPGDNFKAVHTGQQAQQNYDAQMTRARMLDARRGDQGGFIDPATARILRDQFGLTDDEAVSTPANSPSLKLAQSMGPVGTRQYMSDQEAGTAAQKEVGQNVRQDRQGAVNLAVEELRGNASAYRADKALEAAQVRADGAAARAPNRGPLDDPQTFGALLISKNAGVPLERARELYLGGDASDLSPDQQMEVQRAQVAAPLLAQNTDKSQGVAASLMRGSAGVQDYRERAEISTEQHTQRLREDPKYAFQQQGDMTSTMMALNNATKGWRSLSPEGKRALAQFGSQGLGAVVQNAQLRGQDRANASAVWGALNELVKERSGAQVTASEWGRLAGEFGLGRGVWDPFNGPEAIEGFLKRADQRIRTRRSEYERIMGGWK